MNENDTVTDFIELSEKLGMIPLPWLSQIDSVMLCKWYLTVPRPIEELCILLQGYLQYECINCLQYLILPNHRETETVREIHQSL